MENVALRCHYFGELLVGVAWGVYELPYRVGENTEKLRMLLIPGTENGKRGTGNGSLGASVQRQPA